jgi:hypothetical protein
VAIANLAEMTAGLAGLTAAEVIAQTPIKNRVAKIISRENGESTQKLVVRHVVSSDCFQTLQAYS